MPSKELSHQDYHDIALAAGFKFKEAEYDLAWKMYSYREMIFYGPKGRTNLGIPHWTGQDLKGKTLALCYEQTLGEHIFFASMIPELLAMGANLIVETDERLIPLFQRSFPGVTFVPWGFPTSPLLYGADYYTLLGNPGLRLRRTKESFAVGKYLKAKPLEGASLSPCVGIAWHSPAVYDGDVKSIPVEMFRSIYEDTSLNVINLQYGYPKGLPNAVPFPTNLSTDIDGVASLIDACDVVVTISNTVAHLAGALGKPTFVLLKTGNLKLWYWDTLAYPTVTRVVQPLLVSWNTIISDIHKKILDK